jgi:hypothetical protein
MPSPVEKEGKLHTSTRLEARLAAHHYPPLPEARTRMIDTNDRTAEAVAEDSHRVLNPQVIEGT